MKSLKSLLPVLLSVVFLVACATKVNSIKRDVAVNLEQGEGYLMFTVDTAINLEKIKISGQKDIVVTSKDLRTGSNTILLRMPSGNYYFDRVYFRRVFYEHWVEFEPELWRFSTKPGEISYVGHLKIDNPFLRKEASFSLVNRSSEALEYLQQNFANILKVRSVDYQGLGEDNFLNFVVDQKLGAPSDKDKIQANQCRWTWMKRTSNLV